MVSPCKQCSLRPHLDGTKRRFAVQFFCHSRGSVPLLFNRPSFQKTEPFSLGFQKFSRSHFPKVLGGRIPGFSLGKLPSESWDLIDPRNLAIVPVGLIHSCQSFFSKISCFPGSGGSRKKDPDPWIQDGNGSYQKELQIKTLCLFSSSLKEEKSD